jgi:hypothetical protein
MTIPVKIEMAGSVLFAQMHAVPRAGDKLRTAFPAAGIVEALHLVVTGVIHQQVGTPDARDDNEPFAVVVTVDGDPKFKKLNDAVMAKVVRGTASKKAARAPATSKSAAVPVSELDRARAAKALDDLAKRRGRRG